MAASIVEHTSGGGGESGSSRQSKAASVSMTYHRRRSSSEGSECLKDKDKAAGSINGKHCPSATIVHQQQKKQQLTPGNGTEAEMSPLLVHTGGQSVVMLLLREEEEEGADGDACAGNFLRKSQSSEKSSNIKGRERQGKVNVTVEGRASDDAHQENVVESSARTTSSMVDCKAMPVAPEETPSATASLPRASATALDGSRAARSLSASNGRGNRECSLDEAVAGSEATTLTTGPLGPAAAAAVVQQHFISSDGRRLIGSTTATTAATAVATGEVQIEIPV